jgi:hypothetical protein
MSLFCLAALLPNIVIHYSRGIQVAVKLVALLFYIPDFRAEILAENTATLIEIFLSFPQSLQANTLLQYNESQAQP